LSLDTILFLPQEISSLPLTTRQVWVMKYINTRVQSSIPTESYGRVRTTLSWFLFERASQSSHRDPQTGYPDKDHSLRHSLHARTGVRTQIRP